MGPNEIALDMPTTTSRIPKLDTLYQMDHNTLMFIENGGMRKPIPNQIQRLFKPLSYGCGGDH